MNYRDPLRHRLSRKPWVSRFPARAATAHVDAPGRARSGRSRAITRTVAARQVHEEITAWLEGRVRPVDDEHGIGSAASR